MLKVYHGDNLNTINVPYETDRWVKIQAIVDLENDWTQIYYDDNLITEYSWTGGVLSGGGALDIAIVDLFARGLSSIYYDDLRLEQIYPLPENDEPRTTKLHTDYNRNFYVDLEDLLEQALSWLDGLTIADVVPLSCGDGERNVLDFSQLHAEWQLCNDPTNSACSRLPHTLFEPPTASHPYAAPCGQCMTMMYRLANDRYRLYLFSGEFHESVVDLSIASRGLDFAWARKYHSHVGPNTAMGNGWEFSYNIRIQWCGTSVLVWDGNTRKDAYLPQPDGTWAADGFFRELAQDPNTGFYTLIFSDTGEWRFLLLDGSPAAGRITEIRDGNDNTLRFEYDPAGRLERIQDSLHTAANPWKIVLAYNNNGFIESITDFVGRQVRYDYYDGVEAAGSFGDLKSVRSPVVTGTPTGNDFARGKTTVYTYSTGFADERVNHNLISITDPKGQTYITNVYDATTDPADLNFDRVTRQILGDPSDIIDMVYSAPVPDVANRFAFTRVTSNDRMGNVRQSDFNFLNRVVSHRTYTGRADPTQPTDLEGPVVNPPVAPLRIGDPDIFNEFAISWTVDSLPSFFPLHNGN